jgi:hypothetical protein
MAAWRVRFEVDVEAVDVYAAAQVAADVLSEGGALVAALHVTDLQSAETWEEIDAQGWTLVDLGEAAMITPRCTGCDTFVPIVDDDGLCGECLAAMAEVAKIEAEISEGGA